MKKILIGAAILYGGYRLWDKKKQLDIISDAIEIAPKNIRGIKLVTGGIQLTMDIQLINSSTAAFTFNSFGAITIKKIHFYTPSGTYIGTANQEIKNIEIQANSITTIKNVVAVIDMKAAVNNFMTILSNPFGMQYKTEVRAFGMDFTI